MYVCNQLFSGSAIRIFLKFCILLHHYVLKKSNRTHFLKKILIAPKWDMLHQFGTKKVVRLALGICCNKFSKILCNDRTLQVNKSDISEHFEKILISPETGFATTSAKKLVPLFLESAR